MSDQYARPATLEDLKRLIKSLNEQKVDYFLIGGYALYAHGIYRATVDIDFLFPSTEETGRKVKEILMLLPDKAAKDIDPAWFKDTETIRLADEFVVDIMLRAAGNSYDNLKKYMEIIEIEGLPVKTLNLEGLLLTKKTPREKDLIDRYQIEKALKKFNDS